MFIAVFVAVFNCLFLNPVFTLYCGSGDTAFHSFSNTCNETNDNKPEPELKSTGTDGLLLSKTGPEIP